MNFDFLSPVSPALTEKLESGNAKMEEILDEPSCIRAFRNGNDNVVQYFVKNAHELVDLCFDLEKQQISTKAYNILSIENQILQKKLMDDDLLQAIADKIFQTKEPICINRFAVITKNCCNAYPYQSFAHCSNYLSQFIEFIAQPSVYEMFISFFIPAEDKTLAQTFFDGDFQNQFIAALKKAPKEFSSEFGDPNVPYLASLFKFIAEIATNENSASLFGRSIYTDDTIKELATPYQNAPPFLLGSQFAAIQALANKSIEKFAFLIPRLISFVQIPSDATAFHEYQTCAINLLTSLAQEQINRMKDQSSFEDLLVDRKSPLEFMFDANIGACFADIVRRFPGHTIAHSAISSFVLLFSPKSGKSDNLTIDEKLGKSIYEAMIPLINEILGESQRAEQKAFAWDLASTLIKKDISFQDQLSEAAKKCNEKLTQTSESSFGGEVPEKSPANDELGNITPEQMMMLLRLLTGGR